MDLRHHRLRRSLLGPRLPRVPADGSRDRADPAPATGPASGRLPGQRRGQPSPPRHLGLRRKPLSSRCPDRELARAGDLGVSRSLLPRGAGRRGHAGGLGLEAHRGPRVASKGPDPRSGPRSLLPCQPSHPHDRPRVLLRARHLVHPISAALFPVPGAADPREAPSPAWPAPPRSRARPAGRRRAALPAGSSSVRAASSPPQRPARGDRWHARRRTDFHGRSQAHCVRVGRGPVRPTLQRRERVATRDVLPLLWPSRDLLARLCQFRSAAGAHGSLSTARLSARRVRERAGVQQGRRARSDGPRAHPQPASRDGIALSRAEREGQNLDRGVVRLVRRP